ncbi:acid phosphatase [Arenivirga flava]|uniref:acid phosphatase n=1 Tax=Arenivirga flava TaxID=1930060 RepID=UPI0024E10757|nr:phosphatase PAP2 family protein [Arenivirga flava]
MTSARASARPIRLLAIGAGAGVLLSTFGASGAFAAEPFTEEQIETQYPSDAEYRYELIMDQFTQLREDPSIVAHNDRLTLETNRDATPEQVQRAITDQYDDMSISMHDGLGQNLGSYYEAGRLAGDLPKVDELLRKEGGIIGRSSSSNPAKKYFNYTRPYLRMAEGVEELQGLEYRDREVGGDAWGSRSGAFPSGHTSQALWQATSLAMMLPELAPQILARASEAGHNRMVMGVHYPLDVISGRMMGNTIVARRMADEPVRALIAEATTELRDYLETACGAPLGECIAADQPYLDGAASLEIYEERMTYGFERVGDAGQPVTVPEPAEALLLTSHPELDAEQRRQVLALTAIDSGYPLDEGAEGSWQRLNLPAAMSAEVVVAEDGTVSLAGDGEEPGTEQPGGENPGTEQPGGENPGAENPGTEQPGTPAQPAIPSEDALTAELGTAVATFDAQGREVTIRDARLAGQQLRLVLFSEPVDLGVVTFDATGSATVALPASVPAGAHRLAAVDGSGAVLAWASVTVPAAATDRDELSATGASIAAPAAAGVLALLLGAALIAMRRVRASARP